MAILAETVKLTEIEIQLQLSMKIECQGCMEELCKSHFNTNLSLEVVHE